MTVLHQLEQLQALVEEVAALRARDECYRASQLIPEARARDLLSEGHQALALGWIQRGMFSGTARV